MKDILQVAIPVVVIVIAVSILTDCQRTHLAREAASDRAAALQATLATRTPFDPLIDEVRSMGIKSSSQVPKHYFVRSGPAISAESSCVVIDLTDKAEIWLPWCDWPTNVRASSPDDLKVLVLLEVQKIHVGRYGGGGRAKQAYRQDYRVNVYSWPDKSMIAVGSLTGADAPREITSSTLDFSNRDILLDPPDLQAWLFGAAR